MRNSWEKVPIQTIYKGFWDGPHATPKESNTGSIYIGIKNLTEDGHLDFSSIRHISENDYCKWTKRVEPKAGDIVFTYEASLHRYAILPAGFRGCLGRRVALIRPDNTIIDTRFLLYYLLSDEWRNEVSKHIILGATVDRIPLIEFPNFEILLPPLPTQRKIAAILSAYDDLIENNTRRIKILEEMAQTLYRHWFVDYKFPGHENVRLVDSGTELGLVPEGWEVVRNSNKFRVELGGTPSRKNTLYWQDGTIPWINSSEVNKLRVLEASEFISHAGLKHSSTKLLPKRTTLIAITGATLGQVSLLEIDACTNQSVIGVTDERNLYNEYIYCWFTSNIQAVIAKASGSAQQHINKGIVEDTKLRLPPHNIVAAFNKLISPIFDLILNLIVSNKALSTTRDLLLPRLIDGEMDVSEVEISGYKINAKH